MKKTFFVFLFFITNFGISATTLDFISHGDSTLEILKCYGYTQHDSFDKVSDVKNLENLLNDQLEKPEQFGTTHPTKAKSAPETEATVSVNDGDDIMDFIAKTSKITKKDLEHKLSDIVLETKIINEDGVVFLPVIEVARIAETNYDYDATNEIVVFKNEKSTVEMLVKQASIFRNDTLFLPVSKIRRAFENCNIRVDYDKTVKVSPPFKSKIVLVGTNNPDIDTYGASMSVINTKYYSMLYYDTFEQAQAALKSFQSRPDVKWAGGSGTSLSTPIVVAYIAGLISWRPAGTASAITPDDIVPILKSSEKIINTSTQAGQESPPLPDVGKIKVLDMYASMYVSPPAQYKLTLSSNNASWGTVSGGGTYDEGTSVKATASPKSGCRFVNWTEEGKPVSTNANYSFRLNGDRILVANFELIPPQTFTVTFDAAGSSPTPDPRTVEKGKKVTKPSPPTKTDFIFTGWYNGDNKWDFSTDVVNGDLTLTARWSGGTSIKLVSLSDLVISIQNGNLIIKSELPVKKVEIYALTGVLALSENNFNGAISVSALPKGIYIAKIYTDSGTAVKKVVRK